MPTTLTPSIDDLQTVQKSFEKHLLSTLSGNPSGGLSLLQSPKNYQYPTQNSLIQLIVIGGSRTEVCLFDTFTQKYISHATRPTPTLHSSTELLELLSACEVQDMLTVLNFTFPMQPTLRNGKIDGILLKGTKQHSLKDLHGTCIGHFIEQQLNLKACLVQNDVSALIEAFCKQNVQIAGVLGTGSNFGIVWNNQIINLESGNYSDFELEASTLELDSKSTNQGEQLLEKSISGKYLKDHFNYHAKRRGIARNISSATELSSLTNPKEVALANEILEYSAALLSTIIISLCHVTNSTKVVMEGSVFWKAVNYQLYVNSYLKALDASSITFIESTNPFENLATIIHPE